MRTGSRESNKDIYGILRGRLVSSISGTGSFNFVLNKDEIQCGRYVCGNKGGTCNNCRKTAEEHLQVWIPKHLEDSSERSTSVNFHSLRRAKDSLCDFMNSYFPYHNLIPSEDFLHFLGALYFMETSIYQLDEENEESISSQKKLTQSTLEVLVNILKQEEIFDELIEKEMKMGKEYWNLERILCSCPHRQVDLELVDRAIKYKSFDYRILNLVMYKIRGKSLSQIDLELLDFLKAYEVLIEIRDDLCDYDEDITKNSFNVYRMFVKIYGPELASSEILKYIRYLEHNYNTKLTKLPSHLQQKHFQHFKMSKGGMWIWDPPSAIPEEEPKPKTPSPLIETSFPKGKKLTVDSVRMMFFTPVPSPVSLKSLSFPLSPVSEPSNNIDRRNLVSFYNLYRGVEVLQLFLETYFRMYGIPFSSILQNIDVLVWIESQLAQIDYLHQNNLSFLTAAIWDAIEEFLALHKLLNEDVSIEIELGKSLEPLEAEILTLQCSNKLSTGGKAVVVKWLHAKSFHARLLHKLLWILDPQFSIMTVSSPAKKSKTVLLEFATEFEAVGELLQSILFSNNKTLDILGLLKEVGGENAAFVMDFAMALSSNYQSKLADLQPQHQQHHKEVLKALFGMVEWNWNELIQAKM